MTVASDEAVHRAEERAVFARHPLELDEKDPAIPYRLSDAMLLRSVKQDVDWIKGVAVIGITSMTAIGGAILTVLLMKG